MGIVQSVACSIVFCFERILSWGCCAFLLILLMFCMITFVVYGISVGYHYAQKELSAFALKSREPEDESPGVGRRAMDDTPVVRLVAVNRSNEDLIPPPILELQCTPMPTEEVFLKSSITPVIVLETERPPNEPELTPHERELARRLIGRFRRSKTAVNVSSTLEPFLRPLKMLTVSANYTNYSTIFL